MFDAKKSIFIHIVLNKQSFLIDLESFMKSLSIIHRYYFKPSSHAFALLLSSIVIQLLALATPIFAILVIQRYIPNKVDETLTLLIMGVLLALCLEYLLRQKRANILNAVSVDLRHQIESNRFYQYLKPQQHDLSKANGGTSFVPAQLIASLLDFPMACVYIVVIFYINAVLGAMVVSIACVGLIYGYAHKVVLDHYNQDLGKDISKQSRLIQFIHQFKPQLLPSFNSADYLKHWTSTQSSLESSFYAQQNSMSHHAHVSALLTALATVAVYGYGGFLAAHSGFSLGLLIAINLIASRALMPFYRVFDAISALKHLANVLDTLPLNLSPPQSQTTQSLAFNHSLTIDLTMPCWNRSWEACQYHLDTTIKSKRMTVICGDSGLGKTALLEKIIGIDPVIQGNLLLDSVALSHINKQQWWQSVAYLPQQIQWPFALCLRDILLPNTPSNCWKLLFDESNCQGLLQSSEFDFSKPLHELTHRLPMTTQIKLFILYLSLSNKSVYVLDDPLARFNHEDRDELIAMINLLKSSSRTLIVTGNDPWLLENADDCVNLNQLKLTQTDASA